MTITDGFELIAPVPYAEHGPPHDTWSRLRTDSPVHWCEPDGYQPFWAITRHADVCEISKQPERFINSQGIVLESAEQKRILEQRGVLDPAEIHRLASKTRRSVGADEGRAACHSEVTPERDEAEEIQAGGH